MSASSLLPEQIKGAIVMVDVKTSQTTTIAFQYNPETATRNLTPKMKQGSQMQGLYFESALDQTFFLKIMIDARTVPSAIGSEVAQSTNGHSAINRALAL